MVRSITSRKTQTNSIPVRVHQTIYNFICVQKVQDMILDDEKSWYGILAWTILALCATVNNTSQHTLT